MREYTEKEIREIRETFEADEVEHGCGYWSVCLEHECFCSTDAPVSRGFNIEVWDRMYADMREELAELRRECEQRDMELSCGDYPYEAYAAGADWDGDDEEEEDWY